ncbi:MAG: ankyrin repeat domain-containing protein, partial [Acidobacteria bacterium]|nr:ankyrin repeat domain-containing protein [Acidobacteriota bacterium]
MSRANASPIGRSHQEMSRANASPTGRSYQWMSKKLIGVLAIGLIAAVCTTAVLLAADTRLVNAAMQGNLKSVQSLLQQKADVNGATADGMTALHWAAFKDDLEMADLLLKAGADVKAKVRVGGITPLSMAARNGNADMLKLFLKTGADPNATVVNGTTVLMEAALSGSVDAINVLLDAGANPNAWENVNGQTALMFAAWENRAEVIKALVARGADIRITSRILELNEPRYDDDGNPIPERPGRGGGGPTASNFMGGMTALHYAARDGHLDSVKALVEAGSDVNKQGAEGSTPIIIAIANGHYTVGQYLLDHGANPNIYNLDGLGPLWATINMRYAPIAWAPNPPIEQETTDSLELVKNLLKKGADPNAPVKRKLWFSPTSHDTGWTDSAGATPFWRAAQSTDVEAMKVLVEFGADPTKPANSGVTPLMVAAGIGWIGNFNINAPDSFLAAAKLCIELGNEINAA